MPVRIAQQPARPVRIVRVGAVCALGALVAFAACTDLDDLTEPTCAYVVSPMQIDVGNQGGTGTLAIRTPGACAWTIENSAGWVSLTGEPSGQGDANLGYAVAVHEGFDYRYATLTVGGKSVAVSQAGRPLPPPPCTYSVSPTTVSTPAAGGPGSIAVAAGVGCAWTAASQTAWVTITSGASGSGSGAVGFQAAANSGTASRTGSLTAGGQTVTITQPGVGGSGCTFTVAPTSAPFPATGGPGSVTVTTLSGCAWTATSQVNWMTITNGGTGSGSGAFGFQVAANNGTASRTGTLTAGGQTVTVTQEGTGGSGSCTFTVAPTSASFPAAGGAGTVTVTAPAGCAWTARSEDNWIVITSGASGSGNGVVTYTVAPRTSKGDRDGRLTVAGRRVDIDQQGTGQDAGGSALGLFSSVLSAGR